MKFFSTISKVFLFTFCFVLLFGSFLPIKHVDASSGYTTSNDVIYKNGTPITLHGMSWFGFETTNYVVHGLWQRNYLDVIKQMKSIGVNAFRVPYCPLDLQSVPTNSINYTLNPDLANLNSLQVLDKILQAMNDQQMYILLDFHRPDCNAISELWYTSNFSQANWISSLQFVASRYKNLDYFMGLDLKNEPHGSATWGTGNSATDWNTAAEAAGAAVNATNPNILLFVQGVETNPTCSDSNNWHFWGEDLEPFSCNPISNSKIPANKLILSPHVYGPDVYEQSYFSDPSFPQNMPNIFTKHWGYLVNKGFTVVPGEWGGKYGTDSGDVKDIPWIDTIVNYFISNKICNSFYWDLNPNSGDTGGILENDWTTVWPTKLQFLQKYWNNCNSTGSTANTQPIQTTAITTTTPIPTPIPTVDGSAYKQISIPGIIQAEDYNIGSDGIAFHSTYSQNPFGNISYRNTTLGVGPISKGGYMIGYTQTGQWAKYTINVSKTGIYNINTNLSSNGVGGTFHIEIDNNDVTGILSVPDTKGWENFSTLPSNGINITSGYHVLKLYMDNQSTITGAIANFDSIDIESTSSTTPTTTVFNPCFCQTDNICSNACTFNLQSNTNVYSTQIKCSRESALGPAPSQDEENSFCQRPYRTLGDANGDNKVDNTDYFYYIRAVSGGEIPSNVNPDFNGDGLVSATDRVIIMNSMKP